MQTQTKSLEELLVEYFKIQKQIRSTLNSYDAIDDHLDLKYYIDNDNSSIHWTNEDGLEYSQDIIRIDDLGDILFVKVCYDFGGNYHIALQTKNKLTKEQAEEMGIEI